MIAWLRANPRPVVVIVVAVGLIIAFVSVVAPLFNTSGVSTAELAGSLPTQATLHHTLEIDLGVDNTGVSAISPLCIRADLQGGIAGAYAVFQGVDRETFKGDSVCGGTLSGEEDIAVQLFFSPTATGAARITLSPAAGQRQVGPQISTALRVAA